MNEVVGHDGISAYFLKVATTIITQYVPCLYSFFLDFTLLIVHFLKTTPLLKSYLFTKKELQQTQATINLFQY